VVFQRSVYVPADEDSQKLLSKLHNKAKTVVPLDIALGIDRLPFKMTIEMMLDIARRSINARSYQELERYYEHDRHIEISDDQIREVVDTLGDIVYEYDKAQMEAARNGLCTPPEGSHRGGTLYIEMDGAMFNTRDKPKEGSSYRENKLGIVFHSSDIHYHTTKTGKEAHRIYEREYISYVGDADTFKAHLFAVALRNGLRTVDEVVIISDGAPWIKAFRDEYCQGLKVTLILDLCHLKENIHAFAKVAVRGKNRKNQWPEELIDLITSGKSKEALKKVEPYKNFRKPGVPNLYNYLESNLDRINYPSYWERGLFVGSGAIESANKTVMQERLKLSGMRWKTAKAQGVMALKCKYDSGKWDNLVVPLVYAHYGLRPP